MHFTFRFVPCIEIKRLKMWILWIFLTLSLGRAYATLSLICPEAPLTWEGCPLDFSSKDMEKMYLTSGKYVQKNIIATKAVFHLHKMILLTSRYKSGNPCSLVFYDTLLQKGEPVFSAYPHIDDHEEGNCGVIQNAVDMYLDHLGFLWVLDTGIVDHLESPHALCSPKVLCISLVAGKILKTFDLSDMADSSSRLQYIVVDYDHLGKAHLYISDAASHAVLVYDIEKKRGYRTILPECVTETIQPFDTLYLALSKGLLGKSTLYLTYLNSPHIFSIKTDYLKKGKSRGKITNVGTKAAPMIFLGMDKKKFYFRYENEPYVYCWDTEEKFSPDSLEPIYCSEDGFVPTAVTSDPLKGSLKILQSNLQDYFSNSCGVGALQQIVEIKC